MASVSPVSERGSVAAFRFRRPTRCKRTWAYVHLDGTCTARYGTFLDVYDHGDNEMPRITLTEEDDCVCVHLQASPVWATEPH